MLYMEKKDETNQFFYAGMVLQICWHFGKKNPDVSNCAGYGVVNSSAVQTYLALLFFSHIITHDLTTS